LQQAILHIENVDKDYMFQWVSQVPGYSKTLFHNLSLPAAHPTLTNGSSGHTTEFHLTEKGTKWYVATKNSDLVWNPISYID
jgi:hypothetical protein